MRRLYFLLLLLFFTGSLLAQAPQERKCAAQILHTQKLENDPNYKSRYEEIQRKTKEFQEQRKFARSALSTTVREIPVYVHVIYDEDSIEQNISTAQIESQIEVLNEDFRALNTDISGVPTEFEGLVADYQLVFTLDSVTKKSSTVVEWETNNEMKRASTGGVDAITPETHLNIWVCNLAGNTLGYAQFPGGPAETDGVVVGPNYFGSSDYDAENIFYLEANYDKGRTTTHEIGHYLDLLHIWGDGNCDADDEVTDTPIALEPNYGCPNPIEPSCAGNTEYTSDMFMNYMDYVNDSCMFMFSEGQKTRSYALFEPGAVREDLGQVLDGCNLLAPVNLDLIGKTSTTLSLTWDAITDADGYVVWVNGIISSSATNSIELSGLEAGNNYKIRVKANCMDGGTGNYSEILSVNTLGCYTSPLELSITTDNYPEETSWELSLNGTVVQTDSITYQINTTYTQSFDFGDGNYKFEIFDSEGDGICCGWGDGFYTLTDSGGRVIKSGGEFGYSETIGFCVEAINCPNPSIVISEVVISEVSCAGEQNGQIEVEVSGGIVPISYRLNDRSAVETNIWEGLAAGEYSIEVTDANGCTVSTEVTIKSPTPLEISADVTNSNSIDGNGSIDLTVSGGTGSYSYEWSTGADTSMIDGLEIGQYSVIVTDENGCSLENSFEVGGVTATDKNMKSELLVFPNPVNSKLTVLHPENSTKLLIYDPIGKLILEHEISGNKSEIDVDDFPVGLYFIRLPSDSQYYRFIKE